VTSFALGNSVLARNVRNKLFLAFAVLTTLITAWALAFFLNKIYGAPWYQFHLFFNIWLAPASLFFILVLTRIEDVLSRRFLDASVIVAVLLSAALVLGFPKNYWVAQLIYFIPAVVVVQILRLMWIDRKLKRGAKRLPKIPTVGFAKRNLIYIGGLVALCTCVMDHVSWIGVAIPSFGNIALTAYLFFTSQAISQQRLLNVRALFSRFLVLLTVALTLTALYSLLVGWIHDSPELFALNSFIASFLILMLLEPITKVVGYFTQRLLTQEHRRLEQTLRESQRKLAGTVSAKDLFQTVLLAVEQTLQPQWASLFVLSSDGTRYRRVRTVGADESESHLRELLAGNALLQQSEFLHRKGQLPILLDQIIENEIDRSASRAQREKLSELTQALRALGANLLIPLFDSGKILGFVAAQTSGPPEPWGNNWGLLPIIYPYFEQVGRTLHNTEIYSRQKEKERLAAIGEMAAGLAHEIRNPLGAIKGAAQFLDPLAGKPESKFLQVIVEEVDRLNRVVTQFLDYSKAPEKNFKVFDLAILAQKTLELMKPSLDPAIEILFVAGDSKLSVNGSAEQIKQVLLNLIQNSSRALIGISQPKIEIQVEARGEAEIAVVVADNGKGISPENLEKLFIPFFTTHPSGTGLGLSISQKIAEFHGGRIEVASEEGRFARFSVLLPKVEGV